MKVARMLQPQYVWDNVHIKLVLHHCNLLVSAIWFWKGMLQKQMDSYTPRLIKKNADKMSPNTNLVKLFT